MPRDSSKGHTTNTGARRWTSFATVAGLFLLALFLRAFWNAAAAHTGAGFVMSGNDPYYHKRAIDFIQATWTTLINDPLLNYPMGARNPNPPFFEWSVAVVGAILAPLFGGDINTATWWVMEWSPAVWGALTIIPVYYIGRHLFGNSAGIVGAFFLATSTAHIERSALGFADHDAIALFFIVSGFYFYLRAADLFTGRTPWVERWNDAGSVTRGLTRLWDERKVAFGYCGLAGMGVAATGLIWKGYPYAIGVMFIYAVFVMLADHWNNRDSTGLFLGTALVFAIGALVPMPYYVATTLLGFIKPVFFILLSYLVVGFVLVPTRDLPFILVLPAFALAGVAGVLAAFFAVPDVARSLLYSLIYFRQTTLYTTIAEAHPADFNSAVFSVGPLVYFLAIAGILWLAWTTFRSPAARRGRVFMLVWVLVALFMAHSAVRFMFNATPPLAIMGGWITAILIAKLRFGDVPKAMRSSRGDFWGSLRRALNGWQVTGAIFLALLVIFPNLFLAVDAAMPGSAESDMQKEWFRKELIDMGEDPGELEGMSTQQLGNTFVEKCLDKEGLEDTTENRERCQKGFAFFVQKRFGAFGQGFLPDYWREGLDWLRDHDSHIEEWADRPAFLSWWDYGHWAIYVSKHPSVADNFQNGYEFAGNFITAQNETQATQLLAARHIKLFTRADATDEFKAILQDVGVPEDKVDKTYSQLNTFQYAPALNLERSAALVDGVEAATCDLSSTDGCKKIRYFAVDVRLLPYDNPQTPNIEQSSIFYAPVTLAGKDPNNFVEVIYTATGVNPFPESPRYGTAEFNGTELDRYFERPDVSQDFQVSSQALQYKEAFFNSMFYRTYLGQPVQGPFPAQGNALFQGLTAPAPGHGMTHFRLVYLNDQLRMLQYTPGAVLEGTVTDADGEPVEGATVHVYDDAGALIHANMDPQFRGAVTPEDLNVRHGSATTDANGTYSVLSPFSMEGEITLRVMKDGAEVAQAKLPVSREAADAGRTVDHPALAIQLEPGTVEGVVFHDKDRDGQYNATTDAAQAGVTVTVGGKTATTSENGTYRVTDVNPGSRAVSVESDTYRVSNSASTVTVTSGDNVTHDVPLQYKEVPTEGVAWHDADGDDARGDDEAAPPTATLRFVRNATVEDNTARNRSATIGQNGTYAVSLAPGAYDIQGQFISGDGTTWQAMGTIEVPVAGDAIQRDVRYVQGQ